MLTLPNAYSRNTANQNDTRDKGATALFGYISINGDSSSTSRNLLELVHDHVTTVGGSLADHRVRPRPPSRIMTSTSVASKSVTEEQSAVMVRQLARVSFSSIAYGRQIFPEEDFEWKDVRDPSALSTACAHQHIAVLRPVRMWYSARAAIID